MADSICGRGTAPTTRPRSTPSRKKTRSGMLCTANRDEVIGFSSTLSLAMRTSLRSAAICSSTGPIVRHGPHHGAQKSTMTEPLAMALTNVASVTVIGVPLVIVSGVLHLPQTAALPLPSGGTRLACPHEGHLTMLSTAAAVANGVPI